MNRDKKSESEVHMNKKTRGLGHRGGGVREEDTETCCRVDFSLSPPLSLSHLLFLIDLFTSSTCVSSDLLSLWAVVAVDIQQVCRKIQICVFKFSLFSLSSTFITSSAEREKRENFNTDILFSFYTCCVSTPTADREKI